MKPKSKSAPIGGLLAAVCLLGLGGCENVHWPHVYGPNEVPPSVQNAPRPFEDVVPEPVNQAYPRLGDVPSKPKNFTSAPVIDRTKQEMENDRAEAEILQEKAGMPSTPVQ